MHRIFNLKTITNFLYILLIILSLLFVPYYNIRTGFTNWGLSLVSSPSRGPVNVGALNVQRALTFVLIMFYLYRLRIKRKIREENLEIDLAIKESEDRRHMVEREYFKLKRQMQNIFDTMEDFVYVCTKDFKVEFMNKALKNAFGEGTGKKCYEILYKREDVCPWCMSKRVFEGEFVVLEHQHEMNNRFYRVQASPFVNPDGSVSAIFILHDVTKEKEMQHRLESSEKYFRNLFENLPVACFGYDKEAKIVTWNKAAAKLYGFKEEEVLGRSMFETVAQQKDYDKTMPYVNEVFNGKTFEGLQWEDKNVDGSIRYVYTNTYPLYDLDGKISMGISVNIDITHQKLIENQLKDSKEHLEKIMETPQNLVVELDPDFKIKRFNKGCEEVTGYLRSEVLEKDWIELFIPQRLRETIRYLLINIKNNGNALPSHYECPIMTKSGQERVIFWSNTNLRDEGRMVISIIAIGKDVTERKVTQQKIVESEENYRTFLDNVPLHVGVTDEEGKFVIWNKFSEQLFGYKKEEVIGQLTPAVLHETEQEAQEVLRISAQEGIFDKEINIIHKNGSKVLVRLVVVPRRIEGKVVGFCGFAEDISKRKRIEKELLAVQKRLESMVLKDPQTELYNNHYVIERLVSEFERAKRSFSALSVLLMDIDYFKSINDTYGHEFGDKVIVQIAKFLKSELRVNDVVARWGGEEFMAILPEVNRDNAVLIAKKLFKLFKSRGFGDEKNIVNLKCSIGVVSYPEDPLFSPKEMLDAVEKAVFNVKAAGADGFGSYTTGFIKDEKTFDSQKERLLEAIKEKMSFFAVKGNDSILEAIYSLTKSLELKDHPTRMHAEKTVHYAVMLAQRFGMDEHGIEDVRRAAVLHDIGKLGIPDEILLKNGSLTKGEFEIVKQHPRIAADIMSAAGFLKNSIPYVLHHHERFDGKGYPDGLKDEDIPLGARIVSIVDVYEALTSDRPYRKALNKQEALEIIKSSSGTQFDPKVVDEFIKLIENEDESGNENK